MCEVLAKIASSPFEYMPRFLEVKLPMIKVSFPFFLQILKGCSLNT